MICLLITNSCECIVNLIFNFVDLNYPNKYELKNNKDNNYLNNYVVHKIVDNIWLLLSRAFNHIINKNIMKMGDANQISSDISFY